MNQYDTKDWKDLFGDPPKGFEGRVEQTVRRMQGGRRQAAKVRWVPVLAVMLVLLAGIALALGGMGVFDQLGEGLRAFLRPEARELVQQQTLRQEGGTLPHAAAEAVEAINDGRQLYVMLRIRANDPDAALLMTWQDEPAQNMPGRDASFSKIAYDSGRDLVQIQVLPPEGQLEVSSIAVAYEGEEILYTLSMMMPGAPEDAVTLELVEHNLYRDDLPQAERIARDIMTLHIPLTDAREIYAADVPIALPIAGLSLQTLRVERTPIATYLTTRVVLEEDATALQGVQLRDGIWVDWLDERGTPYPDGQAMQSQDGSAGEVQLITAYRAFEALPSQVTLSFYNGMTKERYDTLTIPIYLEGEAKR